MQVFTANEFNKNPQVVYRAADKDGMVRINHDHYKDVNFVLVTKMRGDEIVIVPKKGEG